MATLPRTTGQPFGLTWTDSMTPANNLRGPFGTENEYS